MLRSYRTLLVALTMAAIASLALPVVASAGTSSDLDCSDFTSQEEAQDELDSGFGDENRLDEDGDGEACEEFEYGEEFEEVELTNASVDEYPREGIASGGGSTAAGGLSPLPLLVGAGMFGLLAAGTGTLALRRRLER